MDYYGVMNSSVIKHEIWIVKPKLDVTKTCSQSIRPNSVAWFALKPFYPTSRLHVIFSHPLLASQSMNKNGKNRFCLSCRFTLAILSNAGYKGYSAN